MNDDDDRHRRFLLGLKALDTNANNRLHNAVARARKKMMDLMWDYYTNGTPRDTLAVDLAALEKSVQTTREEVERQRRQVSEARANAAAPSLPAPMRDRFLLRGTPDPEEAARKAAAAAAEAETRTAARTAIQQLAANFQKLLHAAVYGRLRGGGGVAAVPLTSNIVAIVDETRRAGQASPIITLHAGAVKDAKIKVDVGAATVGRLVKLFGSASSRHRHPKPQRIGGGAGYDDRVARMVLTPKQWHGLHLTGHLVAPLSPLQRRIVARLARGFHRGAARDPIEALGQHMSQPIERVLGL